MKMSLKILALALIVTASITASVFSSNANAQLPNQYRVTDLNASSGLLKALSNPDIQKEFVKFTKFANVITHVEMKEDILIQDVSKISYTIRGILCNFDATSTVPCLGGAELTIHETTGTFLPPGQKPVTHYSTKLVLLR